MFSSNSCRWAQSQHESPKSLRDLNLVYSLIEVLFLLQYTGATLADSISHLFPSWVDISLYILLHLIIHTVSALTLTSSGWARYIRSTATAPQMNTIVQWKWKMKKKTDPTLKKNKKQPFIHIYTLLTPLERPVSLVLSSVSDHHCNGSEFTRGSRRRVGIGSSLLHGRYGKDGGSIRAAVSCARLWWMGEAGGVRGCAPLLRQWRAVGIGRSRQTWRKGGVISNIPAASFLLSIYL